MGGGWGVLFLFSIIPQCFPLYKDRLAPAPCVYILHTHTHTHYCLQFESSHHISTSTHKNTQTPCTQPGTHTHTDTDREPFHSYDTDSTWEQTWRKPTSHWFWNDKEHTGEQTLSTSQFLILSTSTALPCSRQYFIYSDLSGHTPGFLLLHYSRRKSTFQCVTVQYSNSHRRHLYQ